MQSPESRLERLMGLQLALSVENWAETNLDIANVLVGVILDELVRDAFDPLGVLHQRQREVEALEVVLQVTRVVHDHVVVQRHRVVGRKSHTSLSRELDHGRRAQAAVQMHVQLRLG